MYEISGHMHICKLNQPSQTELGMSIYTISSVISPQCYVLHLSWFLNTPMVLAVPRN